MAPLLLLLIIHPLSVCFHASINSYRSFLGRLTLPVISSTFSKAFPSCFILKSKYASIPLYYGPDNTPPGLTFEEETELIVKGLLQRVIANGIQGIDPAYLADNAHIISKGKLYEEAMKQLMLSTTNKDELAAMEELDRFLRGYISGERKARARMKIDYLIAGATSNRFEEAVGMLSECDELDEELLICLDNSIEKELKRNPIPNGSSEDMSDDTNSREEGAEEVEYQSMATNTKVSSVNEQILSILRMIRKRITAEMKMKGRDDVKLLGQLLNILSYEERVFIMKKELARIEQVEEFKLFLDEGIDHLVQKGSHAGSVELPIATVEKMKDIRQDLVTLLNQLKTGYQENDTSYSSFKDDIS